VIADRLLAEEPNLRVGVGRCTSEAAGVKSSLADAELALRAAVRRSPLTIVRYEDLDFRSVLLNEVPFNRLQPKMEAWLGPLYENPLLLEAVRAYLQYDLDVRRTARSLRLHPNSVRYRLSRAEEIIGARLRSPETIVALYVSLMNTDPDTELSDPGARARPAAPRGHAVSTATSRRSTPVHREATRSAAPSTGVGEALQEK
jgi:sugar diacid utilization regulator